MKAAVPSEQGTEEATSHVISAPGAETAIVLGLHGGAGLQQQLDHPDVAVPGRPQQWRPASEAGTIIKKQNPNSQNFETFPKVRALEATGVHLGFCRQQLLDHVSVAFPSRRMQGRVALARGKVTGELLVDK